MAELLRRVLTLALVLGAVWAFIFTTPDVVQVHPIDPANEMEHKTWADRDARRMMSGMVPRDMVKGIEPNAKQTPEALLQQMVSGSKQVAVAGSDWGAFFRDAFATALSKPPSDRWRVRYGQSSSLPDYLYFSTREAPISSVVVALDSTDRLMYISFQQGAHTAYIRITRMRLTDVINDAPTWLAHPYREYCSWLLLAALLVYVLIPWPRSGDARTLTYSRGASVVGPDWLGFFLAASFFGIALAAVSYNTYADAAGTPTWWATTTAWCLLATIPGLSILAVGFWYAMFRMELTQQKLRIVSISGTREINFDDIAEVREYEARSPRWLRILTWFVVAASGWTSAYLLFTVNQRYPGLEFVGKNGKVTPVLVSYLPGYQALLSVLHNHGLLSASLAADLDLSETPDPKPRRASAGTVIAGVLALVVVAGLWLATSRNSPTYRLPAVPRQPITDKDIRVMRQGTEALMKMQNELEAAQRRYETAPRERRDAAFDAYMDTLSRYQELSKKLEIK